MIVRGARLMTCDPARGGLGLIDDGALVIEDGRVAWIGETRDAPGGQALDLAGRLVTPGLVDCHTHAIFAGDRANEFAMRAAGKGYLEIAATGGGINATLGPTRAATDEELVELLESRLDLVLAHGTTTIEVKSGYDLTVSGELRLLRCVARSAQTRGGPRIVPTLLAHLVPPERTGDRDAFVRELVEQLIPAVAREQLATSVDVYCDEGAFTLAETTQILHAAKQGGLAVRGHVGQFKDLGAAQLLADLGALSGDHLEQIDDAGIAALARAGIVAVMLPGACVQLRLPVPPIEKLRAAGVAMAVASDLNPGSSYCEALPIQLWLATTHFGMTVEEAWLGVTRHAAKALGLAGDGVGTLAVGAPADFVTWRCEDPATVPYRYGAPLVDEVYFGGVPAPPR